MTSRWKPVPGFAGMMAADPLPPMTKEERIDYIHKHCTPERIPKLLKILEELDSKIENLKKKENNESN